MLRSLFILSGLYLVAACTSHPQESPKSLLVRDASQTDRITLSHVRAYLLIGNTEKAQERFELIHKPELSPYALLALAELRAAKGDDIGAQQAFLQSTSYSELDRQQISTDLLNYFCSAKKWPMLQGYASGLETSNMSPSVKNQQLGTIGLCLFSEQRWPDAYNLLSKLDFSQALDPFTYLALARLSIEQQQDKAALQFIEKFEANKTQVTPEILWTSFVVYSALQQQQLAQQSAQQLTTLFPFNAFTRKYLILTKRRVNTSEVEVPPSSAINVAQKTKATIHLIKKGETLYQLSKRYNISVEELLSLNPNLVIDDISLNTPIQVSRD